MKMTAKFAAAAFGAVAFSSAALAASTNPPGERAGLDLASPLPEGVYFLNIASVGSWRAVKGDTGFDYNVPLLAWSTPWSILGGRIELIGALPEISAEAARPTTYARGLYNPFVAGEIAWNLGNGFSISLLSGAYIAVSGDNVYQNSALVVRNPYNYTTAHEQIALAWHGDGWNATANLMYGIVGDNQTTVGITKRNPDYFNYDLGLSKTIGKWEIGIVAYGSTDVGIPYAGYRKDAQFALGGLIGYNFGPVITQLTISTDLYATTNSANYAQKETRGVLRTIIPLWNPEAPKVVTAKY